jgi:hypothetical protein
MKTFLGGQTVKGGYFLNLRDWKLEVVEGDTGVLPANEDVRYRRVPMLALVVLAPMMGLAFVVLLPFIGLAVIAEQGGRKVGKLLGMRHEAPRPTTTPVR